MVDRLLTLFILQVTVPFTAYLFTRLVNTLSIRAKIRLPEIAPLHIIHAKGMCVRLLGCALAARLWPVLWFYNEQSMPVQDRF